MKNRIIILPLFLFLMGTTVVFLLPGEVVAEGFAGQAGTFLRMGAGAAAMGSGDAGVARSLGLEQVNYNPAGLAYSSSSEVALGYHVLALDRVLLHTGLLYQVGTITRWRSPLTVLEISPPEKTGSYGILRIPGTYEGKHGKRIAVADYLDALAGAIMEYMETGEADWVRSAPVLYFNGADYLAPMLADVVRNCGEQAEKERITSSEEILGIIEQLYRSRREKPAAIAVSWTHAGDGQIEGRNFDGEVYSTLGYHENRFALSLGLKLDERVSIGFTAGILYARISGLSSVKTDVLNSTTIGLTAGMQVRPFGSGIRPYRLQTLTLGLAAYDIAAKNSWNTTDYWEKGGTKTDKYPERYRLGFAFSPIRNGYFYADFETEFDQLLRPKMGIEYRAFSLGNKGSVKNSWSSLRGVVLRSGLDIGKPTFGLGLELNLFGLGTTTIDYAFVVEDVSPENTQVISWRFKR